MRLFTEMTRTYKTQENALKAARKVYGDKLDEMRYLISVTPEGRFHLVFIGYDYFQEIHRGFAVAY